MIILRGPSGAGKTEHIYEQLNELAPDHFGDRKPEEFICSADHFFCGEGDMGLYSGEYVFDAAKLGEAHSWCLSKALNLISEDAELIIIDNTNMRLWEFRNYVLAGSLAGYEIQITQIVPQSIEDLNACIRRNRHGVPGEIIFQQVLGFEATDSSVLLHPRSCDGDEPSRDRIRIVDVDFPR